MADLDPEAKKRAERFGRILAVVMIVVVIGIVVWAVTKRSATPISEQSCSELSKTERQITRDLEPGQSFDTQSQAGKDASDLNDRVDALGGCSGFPNLQ